MTPSREPEPARPPPVDGAGVDALALAAALAGLPALPTADDDPQSLLTRIAALVGRAVPGATGASITLGSPLHPQGQGSDSTGAQEFDGLQLRLGEGPCRDAYDSGTVVHSPDVLGEPRWPALARRAPAGPVRAVLALPLRSGGRVVGVLTFYGARAGAFAAPAVPVAESVATGVGAVLHTVAERAALRDLTAQLERALVSRAVIDQAKGVLMVRLGVDADEAFARLVRMSNRSNVKLRDLARLVVEGREGELPGPGS